MRIDFDTIGDTQKEFEQREAGRSVLPGIPILARLDGVGFHNFVKGLERPYDPALTVCMVETAKGLLDYFHATIIYTQSDEITLGWINNQDDTETKLSFSGKYQKLCSVMASKASLIFNRSLEKHLSEKTMQNPGFDCRVWQVPNTRVAAENFLWRELDATKNSITMAASAYYPHSELHKVSGEEKKNMLLWKGINWNSYPDFFKKGSYFRKEKVLKTLTPEELSSIPVDRRPTGPISRNVISQIIMPKLTSVVNYEDVLFRGAMPVVETQIGNLDANKMESD